MHRLIISCVIIIIVLVIYLRHIERVMMSGMWCADADFCKEAGLDAFLFYLNTSVGWYTHTAYLLVKNAHGAILNNMVNVRLTAFASSVMPYIGCRTFDMCIWGDDGDEISEDVLPHKLQLVYYPLAQKIVLISGDVVHAVLYKDASASDIVV